MGGHQHDPVSGGVSGPGVGHLLLRARADHRLRHGVGGHWRRWRHRVPLFWVLSVVLASVTGLAVFRMLAVADAAAARYGSLVPVPVVARPVGVGSVVGADDVTWRHVPRAFLPALRP